MRVRDIMSSKVVTISPQTSYEDAARILYGNNVSGAPVVDLRGAIVGVITEKDLFRAIFPRGEEYYADPEAYLDHERREGDICAIRREPISKFMTQPALVAHADDPILHAGGILLAHNLHWLPVVDRGGGLAGIVTREDIFRAILQRRLFSLLSKVGSNHARIIHS